MVEFLDVMSEQRCAGLLPCRQLAALGHHRDNAPRIAVPVPDRARATPLRPAIFVEHRCNLTSCYIASSC